MPSVKPEQLTSELKKGLATVYMITGDEPLVMLETVDQIREAARRSGYDERQVFQGDLHADWWSLLSESQEMSLFGDKKLIEVRVDCKLNKTIQDVFSELSSIDSPDTLFLIYLPKLEYKQQKAKWFKNSLNRAVHIHCWPVERQMMGQWLRSRLSAVGFTADQDALDLLSERVDGNLLAAKQEIEKLRLLVDGEVLTADIILDAVADSARFQIKDFRQSLLQGDYKLCLRMFRGLLQEGEEMARVQWAIAHECRILLSLSQTPPARFEELNIYARPMQSLYQRARTRLSLALLQRVHIQLSKADALIKGQEKGDVQTLLERVLFALCTGQVLQTHSQ